MHRADAIVIGAGITGLSAALAWKKAGKKVIVLEPHEAVGGSVRSVMDHRFLCELGPNTLMVSKPRVREFLESAGLLEKALDAAPHAKRRFLVRKDKLVALPSGPAAAVTTPVLSLGGKLRMLAEPFIRPGTDRDETLASFFARRIGAEAASEILGPFVSGVYAGDPAKMIARFAMPSIYDKEREHGSIVRGMFKTPRPPGPKVKSRLVSFEGGLADLPQAMAEQLGDDIRTSAPITQVARELMGFVVRSPASICEAPNLILAVPAWESAALVAQLGSPVPKMLACPYAPMAVVHLGLIAETVRRPMNGFGALISRTQGFRSLGILFSSTLFPGRSPETHSLLTVFIGGATDPAAMDLEDEELLRIATSESARLLGFSMPPVFRKVTRWQKAIPQYVAGHGEMLAEIEAAEQTVPGLQILGSFRGGVSLQDCIFNGVASLDRAKA